MGEQRGDPAARTEQRGRLGTDGASNTAAGGAASTPPVPVEGSSGEAGDSPGWTATIAGLSILKGLILYTAVLTFAGFYGYFIWKIGAANENPPSFNSAMVTVAAALAGVLGSAFALAIGVPSKTVNEPLSKQIQKEKGNPQKRTRLRKYLSLEPGGVGMASWPLTFGIWVYAIVAAAVAIVYFVNQNQTPPGIKALAVAFAGYVLALVTSAYGLASRRDD
jgi:hypothetical protein